MPRKEGRRHKIMGGYVELGGHPSLFLSGRLFLCVKQRSLSEGGECLRR